MRFQVALITSQMTVTVALTNAVLIFSAVSMSSVSHAATLDDYVTCSLVYGALFQAAKNTDHEEMLSYSRPRLQVVLPYIQENKDDLRLKQKLQETSIRLENEITNIFIKEATNAILEEDPTKLKVSMPRVFQCDKAFGLSTLPLPLEANRSARWSKFLHGFFAGCLAKQKRTASPFSDAQIQGYCQCMTDKAAVRGIDSSSSEETTGRIINETHGTCFASIQ